jgi:acetyltransferase EpsM
MNQPDFTHFDTKAILIFGGGGHGKTLIDLIRAQGAYQIAGIIDEGIPAGTHIMDVPVLGGAEKLAETAALGVKLAANAVGGIGNVDARIRVFGLLEEHGFLCPNLIHPSAWIEPGAKLEGGVQVLSQAYVGSEVSIGFGTLLNIGAIAAHDDRIGRVVNLSPNATLAGNVTLEDYVQVGMCASINIGVRVGTRALIGNGATVKSDVPAGERVRAGTIWPIPQHPHPYGHLTQGENPDQQEENQHVS